MGLEVSLPPDLRTVVHDGLRAQSRHPIQVLEEARDSVQTLHVGSTTITTGSVDGHVRTYDLRKGELRSDYIGRECLLQVAKLECSHDRLDPVSAVVPTQDSQTMLVTTLDSHIRLMDMTTGKMLNDFTGHKNDSYRCRACFGHGEASVVCGDEGGMVWAWDLLDVRSLLQTLSSNPDPHVRLN
jgi:mitogen-activated protein kinase organizer 1